MEPQVRDSQDEQLLDNWQRGFPIVSKPFAVIAEALNIAETDVLERLSRLQESGIVARVGGVVRPNTLGASTLAALAAPDFSIDETAAVISSEPGVNHVYLRENVWNLWFVATGPDRDSVTAALQRISKKTGLRVLDLRLEKPYHIDLGFALNTAGRNDHPLHRSCSTKNDFSTYTAEPEDRELVQALMLGLPLESHPFRQVASEFGLTEDHVLARIDAMSAAGILPRIGVIVRHRALGWRSNAMVVWDVDHEDVDRAGAALAQAQGINLCYRRTRYENDWPFNLYCMVHAKSRDEALATLAEATATAGLSSRPRKILFSLRCFKQTGALVTRAREAA